MSSNLPGQKSSNDDTIDELTLLMPSPAERHDVSFDDVPEVASNVTSGECDDDFVELVADTNTLPPMAPILLSPPANPVIQVAPAAVVPLGGDTEEVIEEEDETPTVYGSALPDLIPEITVDMIPPVVIPATTPSPAPREAIDSHELYSLPTEPTDDEPDPVWWEMVESLIRLIGEMEEEAEEYETANPGRAQIARLVAVRLTSLLGRSGVVVIGTPRLGATEDSTGLPFDRGLHLPVGLDGSDEESVVEEITQPGFVVGTHVLRRARVRLKALA